MFKPLSPYNPLIKNKDQDVKAIASHFSVPVSVALEVVDYLHEVSQMYQLENKNINLPSKNIPILDESKMVILPENGVNYSKVKKDQTLEEMGFILD